MLISLIHPTRGRPEQAFITASKIINSASGDIPLEYIICIDEDDKEKQRYEENFLRICKIFPEIRIVVLNSKNCVQSLNGGAEKSTGDILIYVSDDFVFPELWDKTILERTNGKEDWVLWVHDGIQDRIMTSCILDRKYYQRFNYIYNPGYESMYSDNEFSDVALLLNRVILAKDVTIRHDHFSVGGLPNDETYQKQNHPERYRKGKEIYEARKGRNFDLWQVKK